MNTIEQIANFLLAKKIAFNYDGKMVTVTDTNYYEFKYACYHAETKKLVVCDNDWDLVNMEIFNKHQ